jgi:cell division protein FtsB
VAAAVLGTALALGVVDSDAGFETWMYLRAEAEHSRQRVSGLEHDVARLQAEIEALRSDPAALERAIREDLERVRPGEWIVRFAPKENVNIRIP